MAWAAPGAPGPHILHHLPLCPLPIFTLLPHWPFNYFVHCPEICSKLTTMYFTSSEFSLQYWGWLGKKIAMCFSLCLYPTLSSPFLPSSGDCPGAQMLSNLQNWLSTTRILPGSQNSEMLFRPILGPKSLKGGQESQEATVLQILMDQYFPKGSVPAFT